MLAVATTSSYASFELVLVADTAKNTIHRFDGESGAYLGSFGKTVSATWGFNASAMLIKQSKNEVLLTYGSFLARYNYNTGEYLGASAFKVNNTPLAATNISLTRDGASILVTNDTNNLYKFDANTFALQATYTYTSGIKLHSAAETEAGVFVAQDIQAPGTVQMKKLLTNGSSDWAISFTGVGGQMSVTPYNDLNYWTGSTGFDWSRIGVVSASGGSEISMHGMVGTQLASAFLTVPFPDISLTNAKTVAAAHSGFYAGGTTSGGTNLIYKLDNSFTYRSVFGSGIIGSNVAMASVVAPEPGTWLGVLVGACALTLIRRRRK